jgi:sulfur carrier protein
MLVLVNGEPRELAPGSTVANLVGSIPGMPAGRGLAVALDGEVVPRGSWQQTELRDGAQIEVVMAVQGG